MLSMKKTQIREKDGKGMASISFAPSDMVSPEILGKGRGEGQQSSLSRPELSSSKHDISLSSHLARMTAQLNVLEAQFSSQVR